MNFDYGIACTITSSIGSFIGTIVIQKILHATKRNSFLIYVLGSVLGISTIMIPAHTFMQMLKQIEEGKNIWNFNSPC